MYPFPQKQFALYLFFWNVQIETVYTHPFCRFLDLQSLGRVARVSRRFRDLVYADCLWMRPAAECIATNAADPAVAARSKQPLSARDKVGTTTS